MSTAHHPQLTRFHNAWSTMLIIGWVTFAGCIGVWLFSPVPRETILAVVLTAGSLLLAVLQYFSTFRYHREAAITAQWLNGILGGITFLLTSSVVLGALAVLSKEHLLRPFLTILVQVMLTMIFIANANHHVIWSEQLSQAQQTKSLPAVPKFVTLREVFLLVLVISYLLGIVSFGVRNGVQHFNLL